MDTLQHLHVLHERVRIESGHHAPLAQVLDADDRFADVETTALPLALLERRDPADHDVGTQTAPIVAERGDGAVGRHQQRKDVEALAAVEPYQV